EAREVVDYHVANLAAFAARDVEGVDPVGSVAGGVLLVEKLGSDSIGVTFEGDRPLREVRKKVVRDPNVEVDDLALGEAGRVQGLVDVGERDVAAFDLDLVLLAGGCHCGLQRIRPATV